MDRACLDCGYDLSGTREGPPEAWKCPECARVNRADEYGVRPAWQPGALAWGLIVLGIAAVNSVVCLLVSLSWLGPRAAIVFGILLCGCEVLALGGIADRCGWRQPAGQRVLLLLGVLIGCTAVGSVLGVGVWVRLGMRG